MYELTAKMNPKEFRTWYAELEQGGMNDLNKYDAHIAVAFSQGKSLEVIIQGEWVDFDNDKHALSLQFIRLKPAVKSNDFVKPKAKLIGENGNVFNLLSICTIALNNAGYRDKAKKLSDEVMSSGSYDEALSLMMNYVDVD